MDMRVTRNLSTATTKNELTAKRKPRPRRAEVLLGIATLLYHDNFVIIYI